MRGVVSLAVALALPENFRGRDFILAVTFAVILVTVLVQGSTFAPLIRLLHVSGLPVPMRRTPTKEETHRLVTVAQLAAVEKVAVDAEGVERHPRLLEQYRYRVRASTRFSEADGALTGAKREHFSLVLNAIAAGRAELLRLYRAEEVHDTCFAADRRGTRSGGADGAAAIGRDRRLNPSRAIEKRSASKTSRVCPDIRRDNSHSRVQCLMLQAAADLRQLSSGQEWSPGFLIRD